MSPYIINFRSKAMTENEINLINLKGKLKALFSRKEEIQKSIDNFDKSVYADESGYDEYLNEIYGDIVVCGYSWPASKVLYDVDRIAYNIEFSRYTDYLDEREIPEYLELLDTLKDIKLEIEEIQDEIETLWKEILEEGKEVSDENK